LRWINIVTHLRNPLQTTGPQLAKVIDEDAIPDHPRIDGYALKNAACLMTQSQARMRGKRTPDYLFFAAEMTPIRRPRSSSRASAPEASPSERPF
jgi:hypothetical protein